MDMMGGRKKGVELNSLLLCHLCVRTETTYSKLGGYLKGLVLREI